MNDEIITSEQTEAKGQDSIEVNNQISNADKEGMMKREGTIENGKAAGIEVVNDIKIQVIDIDTITIDYHPRKNIGDLKSLQGSIKRDGLQEPLTVYPIADGKYAVIDGYRRLEAVKEFGWLNVPCIIKKVESADAAHLSYVVNVERSGFSPIEVALHIKSMRDRFGYSMSELELKGYGSPPTISKKLKLLDLEESVQGLIQKGEISEAHGLALIKMSNPKEQKKMAENIIGHDLSAKRTEIKVERYLDKGKKKAEISRVKIPDTEVRGVYFKDSRDMSEFPDKSVHLIVTSPPYHVGMEYEKGVSYDEHLEMLKAVLDECARVLVKGGIIALNVADINRFRGRKGKNDNIQTQLMGHKYQSFLRRHQIFLTDQIIWKKSLPWSRRQFITFNDDTIHTSYKIIDNFEPVYIYRKSGERDIPDEDIVLRSKITMEQWKKWVQGVWEIQPEKDQTKHPSTWPDELPRRLISMFSYEGDTILDPWAGSCRAIQIARELNRVGYGYEKATQYKPIIMEKLGMVPDDSEKDSKGPMAEYFEKTMATEDEDPDISSDEIDTEPENHQPSEEFPKRYLESETGERESRPKL